MGRAEPSIGRPPAAFRRDARSKRARATINKTIPALLTAHPRARRGIEKSELIIDPPPLAQAGAAAREAAHDHQRTSRKKSSRKHRGHGDDDDDDHDEGARNLQQVPNSEPYARSSDSSGAHEALRISVLVADTLTAARSLLLRDCETSGPATSDSKPAKTGATRVGILNMASPLSPGGGFLNGATSQEESLCMRTTLLPALRDDFYRLPELGVVYTPDVLVFRSATSSASEDDDVLPKAERFFVDIASAAMLRLPETEEDGTADLEDGDDSDAEETKRGSRYASTADRELAIAKMRAVMRVLASRGCKRVVLGAWGCGAYGNPVREIAAAWRRVLAPSPSRPSGHDGKGGDNTNTNKKKKARGAARRNPETWTPHVEDVVFAIKDAGMAEAFARAFGEDLIPLPLSRGGGSSSTTAEGEGDYGDDETGAAHARELRAKIEELEVQVQQARSTQLKSGLQNVLAGLKKQLPADEGADDIDEDDDIGDGKEDYEMDCDDIGGEADDGSNDSILDTDNGSL